MCRTIYFNWIFLLLVSISSSSQDSAHFLKTFALIPQPQKIELSGGNGLSPATIKSIYLEGAVKLPVLNAPLNTLPLSATQGETVVKLQISEENTLPASGEGYVLSINQTTISILSRGQEGLFYGCQTLAQLMQDAIEQQVSIPACRITDYPGIPYRAIHLDLKHHVNTGNFYYDLIDRLAAIKINAIIIEFEDKLRYRGAPVVGSGNAISVDEFAAISRYARDRNIEISPLIQGLGHAEYILKHDRYANLRDTITSDWSFDPMNPETYKLQFSLYEDAIAATPFGKYLHVGGDEVGHLGMSALARKSGLTPMQLQMMWLNKVSDFAVQHHRIPIFWDDMVFKLSDLYQSTWDPEMPEADVKKAWQDNKHRLDENISLFPKNCVYMRWNYDAPDIPGNHNALDWYKAHDLRVMAATAAQTMWPMLPRAQSNFQPIKDFSRMTAEKNLNGILCTSWDDCSPHSETLWRGFYDFAFFSWNTVDLTADVLHSRFRRRFYGHDLGSEDYNFQDQLERALNFWETALLNKGDRNNYHQNPDLIQLPDLTTGAWSRKYEEKLKAADKSVRLYDSIANELKTATNLARRNKYNLQVLQQINELQVYPAKLLLLLEKYDKAKSDEKKLAKENISRFLDSFKTIRADFEQVYAKTRILSNPDSYVRDQNQHEHLANGTKNDDWMFMYELAINEKIREWLK